MSLTRTGTRYVRRPNGELRHAEPKPLTKRRRRILGMGRKTPNQQRQIDAAKVREP